jgi:hypothetical protein
MAGPLRQQVQQFDPLGARHRFTDPGELLENLVLELSSSRHSHPATTIQLKSGISNYFRTLDRLWRCSSDFDRVGQWLMLVTSVGDGSPHGAQQTAGSAVVVFHRKNLEKTLIGGADVTDRGGFHTDFTQTAGSSRSKLRHPGKATAARMPMKTQNDAMTTETPPAPPSGSFGTDFAVFCVFIGYSYG